MYYAVLAQCLLVLSGLFILMLLPISIARTRRHRAVMTEYAQYRRAAGAGAGDWPGREREAKLMLNPALLLVGSVMVVLLVLLGIVIELLRPDPFHWLPGYEPLAADPLLYLVVIAGSVLAVVLGFWAWRRYQSPWFAVGDLLRRAVYAPPPVRERLFAAALLVDPEVAEMPEPSAQETKAAEQPGS